MKTKFQKLLRPLSDNLVKQGMTPNTITVLTFAFCTLYSLMILNPYFQKEALLFYPLVFFLRMAMNAIDGMMAKEHQLTSSLGGILNEVTDIFSDIFLFGSLFFVKELHSPLLIFFILLTVLTEIIGIAAVQVGSNRRYDGPMGKSDRAIYMSILVLFSSFYKIQPFYLNLFYFVGILLLIYTSFNRIKNAILNSNKNG